MCYSLFLVLPYCFAWSWPGRSWKWELVLNWPTWLNKGEVKKFAPLIMTGLGRDPTLRGCLRGSWYMQKTHLQFTHEYNANIKHPPKYYKWRRYHGNNNIQIMWKECHLTAGLNITTRNVGQGKGVIVNQWSLLWIVFYIIFIATCYMRIIFYIIFIATCYMQYFIGLLFK
jgi:hypothetical protein